jgi:hypothetical protein
MSWRARTASDETMSHPNHVLAVVAVLIGTGFASAQVKEPPRAEKLDVQIRYRIRADRDERIRQFRVLEKHLANLGFVDARKDDPDRDLDILDPTAERFRGTIPSAQVFRLLDDPRVLNILFAPEGYTYPDSGDQPVPIRIALRSGLLPAQQQILHLQVLAHLDLFDFAEVLGYDTRGYTQIKGSIPFKHLDRLVKDLRSEPAGWFFLDIPTDRQPRPFVDRNPIRWVEVMPPAQQPPPIVPEVLLPGRAKLTPELRALLLDSAAKETPVRVVVLFASSIDERTEELRSRLIGGYGPTTKRTPDGAEIKGSTGQPLATEGASLDGTVGNLASIRFDRPADVERFAYEPGVISVRLPRQATETITPLPADVKAEPVGDVLKASGVEALHRLGYTGTGVKVVLVGTDFTGTEKLIGNALPKTTRFLDLTTELNPELVPSPQDPIRSGYGTAAAKTLALAAPDAELVLVRIDPGAIFQLFGIIRVARGDASYSPAMRSRMTDISAKAADLTLRKAAGIEEYRQAFADLADDDDKRTRRIRAKEQLEALDAEQADLIKRIDRFNAFQREVASLLGGARIVVNTLEWESGYPLDALSLLSSTLDKMAVPLHPRITRRAGDPASLVKPPLVWVQAASNAGPSVWGGPFLDANRNGTMEFAPPTQSLPGGSWSSEMNFLGVQSPKGETAAEVPEGTRVRFTMQWREPIDTNFPDINRPAFPVVLRVFRQLDPDGEKQPSDEMAEVARSVGGPYPILFTDTYVIYEQILDFPATTTGRYALVVENGYQPEPLLPALRREVEIHPRIYAETLSAKQGEGRVVFRSYVTPGAGVGIPGDSAGVTTIGVPVAGQLYGGGTGLTLRAKPDLYGPDSVDIGGSLHRGTGIASAYIGGIAVGLVQAGASGASPFQSSGFKPFRMAIVPEDWMRYLRPVPKPTK